MRKFGNRFWDIGVFNSKKVFDFSNLFPEFSNLFLKCLIIWLRFVRHLYAFLFFIKHGYVHPEIIDMFKNQRNESGSSGSE